MPAAQKKASKKAPKHPEKHGSAPELRRAYEHMGRLGVLRPVLPQHPAAMVADTVDLAERAAKEGRTKDAADLLRAAEHLCFAVMADKGSAADRVSRDLKQSLQEHFADLMKRAEKHWKSRDHSSKPLDVLYHAACAGAREAQDRGAYHRALEFARASEALAHIKPDAPARLPAAAPKHELKGA